jgi:regulator of sigma E protease
MVALLVFVHESGHFLAAKAFRVHVTEFSFGFGRRLLGFHFKGTDYRLSLLPFGGYVRMAGADPFGYGEDDDSPGIDPSRLFMSKPVWQRLIIMAAGPAANLVLPVVVFTALLMAGEPQPAPVVGLVPAQTAADFAEMEGGDTILAVEGRAVNTWMAMADELESLSEGPHVITVERDGATIDLTLEVPAPGTSVTDLGIQYRRPSTEVGVDDPQSPAGRAGIVSGERIVRIGTVEVDDWVGVENAMADYVGAPSVEMTVEDAVGKDRTVSLTRDGWLPLATGLRATPEEAWGILSATLFVGTVGDTLEDANQGLFAGCAPAKQLSTPAHVAGLQPGDRFYRLDHRPVRTWSDVLDAVRGTMEGEGAEAVARPIEVEVVRGGKVVAMSITPQVIKDTDLRGVYFYRPVLGVRRLGVIEIDGPTVRRYYSFPKALERATKESVALGGFIFEHLGRLFTGEAAFEKSVGGPVEMVRQAAIAAEAGIFHWARLLGGLSISLGIINFLPVPVLDGGQFLFYLLEGIRGRPLSLALRERAQQIGVLMVVLLMLTVLVTDLHRLIKS